MRVDLQHRTREPVSNSTFVGKSAATSSRARRSRILISVLTIKARRPVINSTAGGQQRQIGVVASTALVFIYGRARCSRTCIVANSPKGKNRAGASRRIHRRRWKTEANPVIGICFLIDGDPGSSWTVAEQRRPDADDGAWRRQRRPGRRESTPSVRRPLV